MRELRGVDRVGVDERAAELAKRSIKKTSKLWALDLAIRCMDLTTLEGADTPGKVAAMCSKAVRPQPGDGSIPSVAAVCIYAAMIPHASDCSKIATMRMPTAVKTPVVAATSKLRARPMTNHSRACRIRPPSSG